MAEAFSGLIVLGDKNDMPIKPTFVQVHVQVVERIARHRLKQTFINSAGDAVQAAYMFPLIDGSSVAGFRVRFSQGREILGKVRERQEAKFLFDDALRRGTRVAMMRQDGQDVFRTSIGMLGPGEQVEVQLEYCLELPLMDGVARLTIPSHVSPRYCPPQGATPEEEVCREACEAFSSPALDAAFSASISVVMSGGVAAIDSPTHDLEKVQGGGDENEMRVGIVTRGLQHDMVVLMQPANFQPVVVREFCPVRGTEALMLNMVPQIDGPPQRLEAVFVLDCSGSMRGARIEQAKRATSIFLRSLPSDCLFNIVLFGSSYRALHTRGSVAYDQASLQQATAFVDAASAEMGGTEMFTPLQFVLQQRPAHGIQRTVFLLTDGQVCNQQQVVDLVRSSGHRVFAIGIGSGVSTSLVKEVAFASKGSSAFVQDHEQLEPVCISMLQKATSPSVSDVAVIWPRTAAFRSQTKLPTLFAGDAFSCFALFPESPAEFAAGASVLVTGELPSGQRLRFEVPIPAPARVVDSTQDALLHHLFARSLIRDVEDAERDAAVSYKVEAIQLSVTYSVLCSYTAFIAVESAGDSSTERCVETDKVGMWNLWGEGQERFRTISARRPEHSVDRLMARSSCLSASSTQFYCSSARAGAFPVPSLGGAMRGIVEAAGGLLSAVSGALRVVADAVASRLWLPGRREPEVIVVQRSDAMVVTESPSIRSKTLETCVKPEQLEALLRLASFDGSFAHSPELHRLTGIEECTTSAWAKQQWCRAVPAEVLVTAQVLAHLTRNCGSQRTTWLLVAGKAQAWLQARSSQWTTPAFQAVDDLTAAAPPCLRSDSVP